MSEVALRRAFGAVGMLLALASADFTSAAEPSETLAERAAGQLRSELPGYTVTISDDLTLRVAKPGQKPDDQTQVNLDRVAAYCTSTPDRCLDFLADFTHRTAGMLQSMPAMSVSAAKLRAVLRPKDYADQLDGMLRQKNDTLVRAPFAGDLVALCYVDAPDAMRPLFASELRGLSLSAEQALGRCVENMREVLPAPPATPPSAGRGTVAGGAIGYLDGDAYESSYLLEHDAWAPLAAKLGGKLLVAAPDSNVILYGADNGSESVDALATLTDKAFASAQRPISKQVFRWTPAGWDVVVAPQAP